MLDYIISSNLPKRYTSNIFQIIDNNDNFMDKIIICKRYIQKS